MNNKDAWNIEYNKSKLITKSIHPQKDFFRFLEWMKKNNNIDIYSGINVLDLGCGIGRNSYYMSNQYGAESFAMDFSEKAIEKGKKLFSHRKLHFIKGDMTKKFPIRDSSIDLILDITSSNALNKKGREKYIKEMYRVLKPTGYLYVRTLAKEGDKNARELINKFPGIEKDSYIHPELHITERVFSGPDFKNIYESYFDIIKMLRKSGYQRFGKQNYKRNYWNIYLKAKRE